MGSPSVPDKSGPHHLSGLSYRLSLTGPSSSPYGLEQRKTILRPKRAVEPGSVETYRVSRGQHPVDAGAPETVYAEIHCDVVLRVHAALGRAEGPRRRPPPGSVNTYQVSWGQHAIRAGAPKTVYAEILWGDELRDAMPGISTVHLLGLWATQLAASAGLVCTYRVFRGTTPCGAGAPETVCAETQPPMSY
jgi:hypothetical protein